MQAQEPIRSATSISPLPKCRPPRANCACSWQIDRTSKFAIVELHREAGKIIAARFTNTAHHKYAFQHIFDWVCDENEIENRLARIKHLWTNKPEHFSLNPHHQMPGPNT